LPLAVIVNIAILVFGLSAYMSLSTMPLIKWSIEEDLFDSEVTADDPTDYSKALAEVPEDIATELKSGDYQCAMILGCGIYADGTPSPMLKDRLNVGVLLYKSGIVDRLLLTGDNGTVEYNELAAMYNYCLAAGVPSDSLYLDYAGFSTYESMYRAREVFQVESMIVVTQKYHMFRALYIANHLGIDAIGVTADQRKYVGRFYREAREVLARDKDLFKTYLDIPPTYLGEAIPITGSAEPTHGG